MKLLELLESKGEDLCYLGTESGSNWIWIGSAKEMSTKLVKMSKHFHKKLETTEVSKRKMSLFWANHEYDGDLERLHNLEKAYMAQKICVKTKDALENWIDFSEREAKAVWNEDQQGWLIKVPGIEVGTLWWKGEKKTIFD